MNSFPINPQILEWGGQISRTIKGQYQQTSPANLCKQTGSMAATGVIAIFENEISYPY